MTWPLMRDFSVKLGGNELDPWQTLWGFWWLRNAGELGGQPMFSRMLWWPDGVPLWFQTWDLPAAIAVWPLWGWVPDVALYNLALFATFPLSGLSFFLLCRYLWGDTLGSFFAGCLYTFSTFHFAHATSTLHIASMQWCPLFFLGLMRTLREPGFAGPSLAGVGLGLAPLASPYHLLFSLLGGAVVVTSTLRNKDVSWNRHVLVQWAVLLMVFAACAGWLLFGMAITYFNEPFHGRHAPVIYSADLQSFFLPSSVNQSGQTIDAWKEWIGLDWEYGSYTGYVALALAVAGALLYRHARPFVVVALIGAVLALGPQLHIGGTTFGPAYLPYAWLERALPALAFGGMPIRLTWLTTFGIAAAAGATLCRLSRQGIRMKLLALTVTLLALGEVWPRPFPMTALPRPTIFRQWAADRSSWAVLDATFPSQALLNQMVHRHPILAGYITRTPERVLARLRDDPFLSIFYRTPIGRLATPRLPVSPEEARNILLSLHVRFVVVDVTRAHIARQIGLVERYQGEGIYVFEVIQQRPL